MSLEAVKTSLKFKLVTNDKIEGIFTRWAGAARFVYNISLCQRIYHYDQVNRKSTNYYDQANELKDVKKVEGYEFLKEIPAQCLQQSLKDLDKAFQLFFRSGFGFPSYKKRGKSDSFRLPDPKQFSVAKVSKKRGVIDMPKVGRVYFRLSRRIDDVEIKNATIKKEVDGWYVSFSCEKKVDITANHNPSIGVDRGITQTIALSDESNYKKEELNLPSSIKTINSRIKTMQRRLKRMKKGSKNKKKIYKKIALLHAKVARIRADFHHKLTTKLAKNHGIITVENLNIRNMTKTAKGTKEKHGKNVRQKSGLNREILSQGWGMFASMLTYKTYLSGSEFVKVPARYTSQTCSSCLFTHKENRKNKEFKCLLCGHNEDADTNAAKNINRAGLVLKACGGANISSADETGTCDVSDDRHHSKQISA